MRTTIARLVIASLAFASLVACTDQRHNPLAPAEPSHLTTFEAPTISPICNPRYMDCNPFIDITAGDYHTCARRQSGAMYCWGRNDVGQVGFDTTESCGLTGEIRCVRRPHLIKGVSTSASFATVAQVAAGGNHTCALAVGGAPWCWGSNSFGEAGTRGGLGAKVFVPQLVSSTLTFTAIGAGGNNTCAAGAGVYCWGNGLFAPTMVSWLSGLTSIAVASEHTCVLGGFITNVYCWGTNNVGQLGLFDYSLNSGWVDQLTGATRVSVAGDFGRGYTCADQSDGTVQCFGDNYLYGMLGNPLVTDDHTFFTIEVKQTSGAPLRLHGVTTGLNHACALDPYGAAWCWGNGDVGQLGNNAYGIYRGAVPVVGGLVFRALAAGRDHTCGLATDSRIYCWGDNEYGQLGAPNVSQTLKVPTPTLAPM